GIWIARRLGLKYLRADCHLLRHGAREGSSASASSGVRPCSVARWYARSYYCPQHGRSRCSLGDYTKWYGGSHRVINHDCDASSRHNGREHCVSSPRLDSPLADGLGSNRRTEAKSYRFAREDRVCRSAIGKERSTLGVTFFVEERY